MVALKDLNKMRNVSFVLRIFAVCMAFSAIGISGLAGEILGQWSVGQQTTFELTTAGQLREQTEGGTVTWDLPARESKIIRIEFGLVKGEEIVLDGERTSSTSYAPFAYDSNLRLYQGDPRTRTWSFIGYLPEGSKSDLHNDRLVIDTQSPGRMYWAGGGAVWASLDGGKTWNIIKTVSDPIQRLVLGLDRTLYAFGKSRAFYGPLDDSTGSWDSRELSYENKSIRHPVVIGNGKILVVPEDGGFAMEAELPNGDGSVVWRRGAFPLAKPAQRSFREVSTRTATTQGCRFEVFRYASTGNWILDNYWDFNANAMSIRVDVRFKAGDRDRCVWSAPFSSPYWSIETASGRRLYGGPPGEVYVRVPSNPRSYAFIRAIAFHVENKEIYKACNPTRGPNDLWAIVVQNSPNGGTACQALQNVPTRSQAAAEGRTYLEIPLVGANLGCPQTSFRAIACVAERASLQRSVCSKAYSLSPVAAVISGARQSTSGAGECVLPDPD